MSQKIKKNALLISVLLFSFILSRCQNDDILLNKEAEKVSVAKKWFKEYESNGDNLELFQNLNYDWTKAELKNTNDGIQLIIVPIEEVKKDEGEIWEQKLYIYKVNQSGYRALLYEIYPETEDYLTDVHSDTVQFNGFVSVWDLKAGFVRSAKFQNNKIVENGVAEVVIKKKQSNNITRKAPNDPYDTTFDNSCQTGGYAITLRTVYIESNTSKYYDLIYNPRGSNIGGSTYEDYTCNIGGGGGGSASVNPIMPPPPKLPISDIKKFLNCLNTAASANLTVYAEKTNLAKVNVGHAFISISQGNNVMIYGFYPENGYDKSFSGPGIMGDNGEHAYDVSGNIGQITPQQLQKIISLSEKYQNSWYDLDANNCSDFTADVLNIVGVASNNSFETPVTVANTLQKVPNHTSNPSYAPKTKRTCL